MCRHDTQDNENGAYYVTRIVIRENNNYNPMSGNDFGGYQNA